MLAETGLSFLGFGVQPPDVSLGTLIADGTKSVTTFPWLFLFPAGVLVLIIFCANLIGDGLRDALDPGSRALRKAAQMSLLEVRDLTVAFPTDTESVSAVRGMNFHVDPGEVVALVGESGAGKSASAMAVVGLLPEYAEVSGSVRLHGDELIGLSDQTDVADPRQVHRHGVPGPDVGAHPRLHRGRPDRRSDRDPPTRHRPGAPPEPARSNCSSWSVSPSRNGGPGPSRTNCPAANDSVSSSPSRSPTIPIC